MTKRVPRIEFISVDKSGLLSVEASNCLSVDVSAGDDIHKAVINSAGRHEYKIKLNDTGSTKIEFFDSRGRVIKNIDFGQFSGIGGMLFSYNRKGAWLARRSLKGLILKRYSPLGHVILEAVFLLRILANWNVKRAKLELIKHKNSGLVRGVLRAVLLICEAVVTIPGSIIIRLLYYIEKRLLRDPLWIISDRGSSAGDNGEALFRYILDSVNDGVRVFFAVSKRSTDFRRIKLIGPVLNSDSLTYKVKFLLADKIISSHANPETTNPFRRLRSRFVDLMNFDFVFLQHGVMRHDHSTWLNKYEKNIKLMVTSSEKEYESVLKLPYFYNTNNLVLSGLPRFDFLDKGNAKRIVIAPTYRLDLFEGRTNISGDKGYDPEFKHSDYFKFYNSLLNDNRLISAINEKGFFVDFCIHPNFQIQLPDFVSSSERVNILRYPYDYKKLISEGSLLVTDYSSVVFDFAYLNKPVIYTKFDEDGFYKKHTYERSIFFDDVVDGFGPVTYTYDRLVEEIVRTLKNNCTIEDKYSKRAKKFFYKMDKNNSKRVHEAITRL